MVGTVVTSRCVWGGGRLLLLALYLLITCTAEARVATNGAVPSSLQQATGGRFSLNLAGGRIYGGGDFEERSKSRRFIDDTAKSRRTLFSTTTTTTTTTTTATTTTTPYTWISPSTRTVSIPAASSFSKQLSEYSSFPKRMVGYQRRLNHHGAQNTFLRPPTLMHGTKIQNSAAASVAQSGDESEGVRKSTKQMLMGYVESIEAAAGAVMGIPSLRRIAIWAGALALAVSLRQFSSVALGTFVLVLIGNTIVDWLTQLCSNMANFIQSRTRMRVPGASRKFIAGTYILSVIVLISTATVLAVPRIMRQGQYLMQVIQSDNPYAALANGVQQLLGNDGTEKLESFLASVYPEKLAVVTSSDMSGVAGSAVTGKRHLHHVGERLTAYIQETLKEQILTAIPAIQKTLRYTSVILSQSVVSFVFSSITVYDYPNLRKGMESLGSSRSRVQFIYHELAPAVRTFGRLISQAFEVQFVVAVFNTIFTTIGLMVLGLPGVELLSFVTLIFSFIPVVGWMIACLPMGIVALSESGFKTLVQVLLMVIGVHGGLVLALPAFASAKLKLHPLAVLVALYLSEHFVGVQGLFLVIPVTVLALNLLVGEENQTLASNKKREEEGGEKQEMTRKKGNDDDDDSNTKMAAAIAM